MIGLSPLRTRSGGLFFCALFFILIWLTPPAVSAAPIGQPSISFETRDRFAGISRQRRDYTCGFAALSTLLRNWHGDTTATEDALLKIWQSLPASTDHSLEAGLRRSDLTAIINSQADRYAPAEWRVVAAEDLSRIGKPFLVLVQREGETDGHYAVAKGVEGKDILLADPLLGHVRERLETFIKEWARPGTRRGLILVVDRSDSMALARSPLHLPSSRGGVTHDLSVREASLRGRLLLPQGARSWSVTAAYARESNRSVSGTRSQPPSKSVTAAVAGRIGLRSGLNLLGSVTHEGVELHIPEDGLQTYRTTVLSAGFDKMVRGERDDGSPSVVLGSRVHVDPEGSIFSLEGNSSLQRNVGDLTFTIDASILTRIENSSTIGQRYHASLSSFVNYEYNEDLSLWGRTQVDRAWVKGANVEGASAEIGLAFAIFRGTYASPYVGVMRNKGAWSKFIGITLTFDD
jgi:hypothetical protein